ncbi:hypothetical protein M011DRAFT_478934 [Sporormia fimetaria CBS 119925]|uniref:Homeobox domain-containing protein n=1 Tax=Sporormia fimetaria CBS 119925 TaxID=1340428 RepID=A0A6A6V698_9PLEO|nr:hypothetical protein M011DRAFT_478934 [Sporormia fimetaria CBS 119925]
MAEPPKPAPPQGPDGKSRLSKAQHDVLEAHFAQQSKPTTNTKKAIAERMNVSIDKINNWFQNRRAKVKQEYKRAQNAHNQEMGIYGPRHPQLPNGNVQFPVNMDPPPGQPQMRPPMTQVYPPAMNVPTASLAVQNISPPPPATYPVQFHASPFDHSLRPIPEANQSVAYNSTALMHSLRAAALGPSYVDPQQGPVNMQDSANMQSARFSLYQDGLAQDGPTQSFPHDFGLSVSHAPANQSAQYNGEFSSYGYTGASGLSLTTSPEGQNSTASASAEQSPFSGVPSTTANSSSTGPGASAIDVTSVFANYTDEQDSKFIQATDNADAFDATYGIGSETTPNDFGYYWGQQMPSSTFNQQTGMYQHSNASINGLPLIQGEDSNAHLGQLEVDAPPHDKNVYSRRNSSTTNLASNIEAIHIQSSTPEPFTQPNPPSSIAARRRQHPAALNASTLRSASFTSGMASPGNGSEQTLRRIRSSGFAGVGGRIQKPSSAQRSPMTASFAEAAASPKFASTFSSASTSILGAPCSLAPPTPITPSEAVGFSQWQGNGVTNANVGLPEHSSPDNYSGVFSMDSVGTPFVTSGSPPSTPANALALRMAGDIYRDTPPQSAPATQAAFPQSMFARPPTHMQRNWPHSSSDLTMAQPKPSHVRRPSLPEGHPTMMRGNPMLYPANTTGMFGAPYDLSFNGISHNVPFAPPAQDPFVHEYGASDYTLHQGAGPEAHHNGPTGAPQKSYVFANQGPDDFVK